MPAAMVKKWAKEQGFTNKEAERRWKKAKLLASREGRNPEDTGQQGDWKYVVGIYKTMMHKKGPKVAEHLICKVLEGMNPANAIHNVLCDLSQNFRSLNSTINVGADFDSRGDLKTFFDGYGNLRFCDENDILINPMSDYRLVELTQYADSLDTDNPLFDLFENYEGSLEELYKKVTDAFSLGTQLT